MLFRYFASHGFDTVKNLQLKLACPVDLNDPFEFCVKDTTNITDEGVTKFLNSRFESDDLFEYMKSKNPDKVATKSAVMEHYQLDKEAIKRRYSESYEYERFIGRVQQYAALFNDDLRIGCFCRNTIESVNDILMWSHYAAMHKGMRIMFDFSGRNDCDWVDIEYSTARPEIDVFSWIDTNAQQRQLVKMISRKSIAWSYEHETRMYVNANQCLAEHSSDGRELYFLQLFHNNILRVDFGLNCVAEEVEKFQSLVERDQYSHIRLFQAKHNRDEYSLEYEAIN